MIKQFIHKIFLVVLLIFCTGNIYSQATLVSDQEDYGPGSTATFTGSGFQPGEEVHLVVMHIDETPNSGEDHGSWIVTADAEGNFVTTWHVCEDDCLGSTLRATADGISSGLHAEVIFTDGNLSNVTIGTQSGIINYGTGTSVTYSVNVIANASPSGTFAVTMTASGLPAGVTGVTYTFSPATFTMAPGATQPVILTVTTINTTTVPSSPAFNVLATGGGGSGSKNANGTLTINKKVISGSITVSNKIYDASTTATITSRTLTGVINADAVTYTGGTATFSDKNAGIGKTVNATGLSLTGAAAGNYSVNSIASTTATIFQKSITGTINAQNKVYNGNTIAVINNRSLIDDINSDNVNLSGGTGNFDNKNVGTGKTVTLTGYTLTGSDAGNYNLTSVATTTANITRLSITGSFTAANKVYDATTTATVLTRTANSIIAPDDVSLIGGTATFDTKNIGTGKVVTLTGASLSGADAFNYSLTTVGTTTANITALSITGSFTAANKIYDATTTATVLTRTANGIIAPDDAGLTGGTAAFDDKNIGIGKTVTLTGYSLTGVDAGNYNLTSVGTTTADITALEITGSFTAANKIYDATTTATVLTRTANSIVSPDDVSLTGGIASFDNKNVGTAKTVSLTGAVLSGADAFNYSLTSVATTTANISQRSLTITAAGVNKVYDGTTAATVTLADNRLAGDVFANTYASATFTSPNVGNGIPISVSGITITGLDAGNYSFNTTATTTANITPLTVATTVTVTPNPQQYSDVVSYYAKIIGGAIGSGAATSVTFKVGTQTVATVTLVVSGSDLQASYIRPLLEPSFGTPPTGQMAPGVHTVTACFNNVSTNFTLTNATTSLTITKENASAFYTGGEFASTGNATSSTAGIRLSATVIDTIDANRGNIRNAKVRFKIQPYSCSGAAETVVYTSWRPVSLISAADTTTGTASLDTIFNISNCDAKIYDLTVEVGGYYSGNTSPVTITVAKTLNDFITGGGHLDFGSGTANKSSGIYKSSDNSKVNFGFNVKYNKNKTNLQGNVNVIIRSGDKVYQVKGIVGGSNGALSVDATNKKAILTSKVSMIDLATGLAVPYSNTTMELRMSDIAEPGVNIDTYGVTIWSGNTGGSLLYSSNWSGISTNEVAINGGNIQVRSASAARMSNDTTSNDTTNNDTTITDLNNIPNSPYTIKVFPNPTDTRKITVSILGSDQSDKPVQLYVYDVTGKLIYTDIKFCLHDCNETVLNLDGRYSSGTYLINVVIEEKAYHQKLVVQ